MDIFTPLYDAIPVQNDIKRRPMSIKPEPVKTQVNPLFPQLKPSKPKEDASQIKFADMPEIPKIIIPKSDRKAIGASSIPSYMFM